MDGSNIVEIPGFLQNKIVKRVIFSDEGIRVETVGAKVFIPTEKISAFRYRTVFTYGYRFIIGRQYVIETRDFNNKIFEIKLGSFYGIRRKTYYKLWIEVFNQLWAHYFINILNTYVELYNLRQSFELSGVQFLADGISWDKKNKLLWKEIALSNYITYFMIHHVDNPKQHKSCSFANDWNAFILQRLLKSIVNQHKRTANA